ncbi:MAG: carbon-nitrogen hydrolase family protein [Myxococcales bacterium]|nr:carbon-nitrogen hydrolase family protein [Myxococcales bacterium]
MASPACLRVALISDVFPDAGAQPRLLERLRHARDHGAQLAVLPELPLQPWAPATREVRDEDAEPPGGPRQQRLAAAAAEVGIAVLGGAIVVDPATGRRHNEAMVVDEHGQERGRYAKLHLPQEPGFWEADHYEPGAGALPLLALHGVPFGIQICSDINRPQGTHVLAARGARLVCHPRATEPDTFDEWELVMRAAARTASTWIVSVNRPAPEGGTPLGGPSIAIDPMGEVVVRGRETFVFVDVDTGRNEAARRGYPGYLAVRSEVYAGAWGETLAWGLVPVEGDG